MNFDGTLQITWETQCVKRCHEHKYGRWIWTLFRTRRNLLRNSYAEPSHGWKPFTKHFMHKCDVCCKNIVNFNSYCATEANIPFCAMTVRKKTLNTKYRKEWPPMLSILEKTCIYLKQIWKPKENNFLWTSVFYLLKVFLICHFYSKLILWGVTGNYSISNSGPLKNPSGVWNPYLSILNKSKFIIIEKRNKYWTQISHFHTLFS